MVHPEIKFGYHAIKVRWPPKSEEVTEMFIGRFKSDNQYHLLGHRPTNFSCYFPESSETNQDLGVVSLPHDKKGLKELIEGEIFFIKSEGKKKRSRVEYIRHS